MTAVTEYTDLAAFVLAKLQATSAVTDLVVNGAVGILDAGELTGAILNAAEKTRQASKAAQVLTMVVVDAGETGAEGRKTATASVFIYDRQRGYSNIRLVREAVITALVNQGMALVRSAYIRQVFYASRTGFVQFEDFDLDYEGVALSGLLTYSESADIYA